jgi:hypothetical protein
MLLTHIKMPMWNGEFGPVYDDPSDGPDWEKTNESRYGVLKCQLELYAEKRSSWSIWLYKGMSEYSEIARADYWLQISVSKAWSTSARIPPT